MLKVTICITYTFLFTHLVFADFEREDKWEVSPKPLRYASVFFGAEILTYLVLRPKYIDNGDDSTDFDFNPEVISTPEWAYQLGNHGPTLLTIGQYLYYYLDDDEYNFEKAYVLTESLLITQGSIFTLKYAFNSKRPDQTNYLSFPSGHTGHAFSIATFMAMDIYYGKSFRKNLIMTTLPILYASFIAYTRTDAQKHRTIDVGIGGLIGSATSYFLYKYHFDENGKYKFDKDQDTSFVVPSIDPVNNRYSLSWNYRF